MTDLFIKVKTHQEQQLPFVLYAKPNAEIMLGLFQKNDHLYFLEDFASKGFIFSPFDGDLIPFIPQKESDVYVERIVDTDYIVANAVSPEIDQTAKIVFENLAQRGIDAILKGTFEKVVLSRKEEVLLRQFDLESVFKKLIAFYPTAFKYCFYHPKIGMWMGATPEQFLKINQKALETVALAGTQIATNAENVIWPEKEIEEQRLVTEFITTSLQDKVSEMTVSSPYTVKAGHLFHIKTDITATIKSKKAKREIITTLHPTSAVCGLPKESAKAFILKNESHDREYYSGFLGELNIDLATFRTEQSDLFVNLRCMKIIGDTAQLFIGCGVTKDSVPTDEFMETVNKSMTMRKVL